MSIISIFNPWLVFALIFLVIWIVLFLIKKGVRKEMLWASILTAPFGLTEPLFVPEYWNPPSLFNLAAKTGFDIESLIFCFAVGGIGAGALSFLPYDDFELSIASILILGFSILDLTKKMYTCEAKPHGLIHKVFK